MFFFIEQTSPDVQWRNREKRDDTEHLEMASFSFIQLIVVVVFEESLFHLLCSLISFYGGRGGGEGSNSSDSIKAATTSLVLI